MTSLHRSSDVPEESTGDDIYRGVPPPPGPAEVQSVSSSSSRSSGSFLTGIGALAAVVEHAISRWARRNTFDSSSSSSSSTSSISSYSHRSSILTYPRSRSSRRRRQRSASVNVQSVTPERDIAARIRARQQARQVPPEFTLYLPQESGFDSLQPSMLHPNQPADHVYKAFSLPHVLGELESFLKKSSRLRKSKEKARKLSPIPRSMYQDFLLPDTIKAPSRPASFTDLTALRSSRKGKRDEFIGTRTPTSVPPGAPSYQRRAPKAWWLDVASPTWDDVRAIGKLLHLHPLTLEDILQQDTREKLELFPKLGYHFIVFRAIEGTATREQSKTRSNAMDDLYQVDEASIGGANVYLVVFREGICTFHFTDISEHIERVHTKVKLLQDSLHMSSDWIAHGLLDSIVDAFFPSLKKIETEVTFVETAVFSGEQGSCANDIVVADGYDKSNDDDEKPPLLDEKLGTTFKPRTRFSIPRPTPSVILRRVKRKLSSFLVAVTTLHKAHLKSTPPAATATTLQRIAHTRRLVTSLARLLASKSEVVSQTRKRFLTPKRTGPNIHSDDVDIAIYMGDVQDHILTLQQTLIHHEHILNELLPAYLSQLRMSASHARKGTDKFVLMLTFVSLGALLPGPIIGLFSMNVHIPRNTINPPKPSGPYYWFAIVLSIVILAECGFFSLVRYWWLQSKRRRRAKLS